ncbi:MAG: peptidoglycan-associated lipoprotein Pal [Gemmatimonadota bacterium]
MRSPFRLALAIAAVVVVSACGSKKPPEQPAPQPTTPAPSTPAPTPPAPTPAPVTPSGPTAEDAAAAAARITASVLAELGTMVHFDFDQADIRTDDKMLLDRKAAILGANQGLRVTISGHADERGSDEYNLALGTRRAAAVKTYLANKGIDGGRLTVTSYGEERPLAAGHDEDAWAQNRRAEFEPPMGAANLRMP